MSDKKGFWDGFENWTDIKNAFECEEAEPEEVIVAVLDEGYYDGSAYVIYRNKDKYYILHGSHCSCYGFEDQFYPEEYEKEEFKECMKRANFWFSDKDKKEYLKKYVEDLK